MTVSLKKSRAESEPDWNVIGMTSKVKSSDQREIVDKTTPSTQDGAGDFDEI